MEVGVCRHEAVNEVNEGKFSNLIMISNTVQQPMQEFIKRRKVKSHDLYLKEHLWSILKWGITLQQSATEVSFHLLVGLHCIWESDVFQLV